jgi:hypothetical protein
MPFNVALLPTVRHGDMGLTLMLHALLGRRW